MRLAHLFPVLGLVALLASPAAAFITPIDSLHMNNANGLSKFYYPTPRTVTIQGTVTCPDSIYSKTATDCYIQDATGGVDVFKTGGLSTIHMSLGDSVQVTGQVKMFDGLVELDSTVLSVTHLGPAAVFPDPLVLNCIQINNAFNVQCLSCDPWEGSLVRVNGVTTASGSWPTTTGSSDVTLTISDGTATSTLFIDKDSPVNGSASPGTKFDVIGILKQFKTTSPFTTGYELVPRFTSDIIPECPGPRYVISPSVTQVDSTSFTISWKTDTLSTSYLIYGTTTNYTDSIGSSAYDTLHSVTINGLAPRSVYHYKVKSEGLNGFCYTGDQTMVTWPSPGTPGKIVEYFNFGVDTTVARPGVPKAQGYAPVQQKLIDLINSAHRTLDCALYSFSLSAVTDALIAAKNTRGIRVRLIIDATNSNSEASRLTSQSGASYITSTYAGSHGPTSGNGIMHSKYVIVDADSPVKDSATVWTGSWNCSQAGQDDCNNTIIFQDYGLAQAYKADFEQMWGGSAATPNATFSRMGNRKTEVAPHQFMIGGLKVEAYFSPSDRTESHLIEQVQKSQLSELFNILDFTSDPLSAAMKAHRDSIPNYVVRGQFEPTSIDASSEWCKLDGEPSCTNYWNPRADVFQDGSTEFDLLHHKYAIFDEGQPTAVVWTGSHNWSNAANTVNDENSVCVHDFTIANVYFQEWYRRYKESGGSYTVGVGDPLVGGALSLWQSEPNPTHGTTRIRFAVPASAAHGRVTLRIYDPSGRVVRSLLDGPAHLGSGMVNWDGRDSSGHVVSAGIYFYRLTLGGETLTRKMALVR